MKRTFLLFFLLTFIGCSPKLRTSVTKSLPELAKGELVVVLDISDDQTIAEEKIGEIKATDNGLSSNCSYYENILNLKSLARQAGANLVKITKHKQPDKWSTCNRLWAAIYRIDDVKKYETEIEWTQDRLLTWNDFKGSPDLENFPEALAVTNSGIALESSSFNPLKEGKIFVKNVFYNHGSWVLPEGRNDYVLKHEQIHFDITEIYTRKLRKALIEANITANKFDKAQAIFETIKSEWKNRQEYYDYQTEHGVREETQKEWEAIVQLELASYNLYKEN